MATQAKSRNINESIKMGTANSKPSSWQAKAGLEGSRNGWFNRVKHCAGFHKVKVCSKFASVDAAAEVKFCGVGINYVFIKVAVQRNKFLTLMKTVCTCIGKQERTMPDLKASKYWATLLLAASAPRDNRLKPLLVYHFGNRHALKGINKPPYPCISDRTIKHG